MSDTTTTALVILPLRLRLLRTAPRRARARVAARSAGGSARGGRGARAAVLLAAHVKHRDGACTRLRKAEGSGKQAKDTARHGTARGFSAAESPHASPHARAGMFDSNDGGKCGRRTLKETFEEDSDGPSRSSNAPKWLRLVGASWLRHGNWGLAGPGCGRAVKEICCGQECCCTA